MPGVSFAPPPALPVSPSYPPATYDRSQSPSRSRSPSPSSGLDNPFGRSGGPVEIEFESAPLTLHPDGYDQAVKGWSASQTTLGGGAGYSEVGRYDEDELAVGASGGRLALPRRLHRSESAQSLQDWQDRAAPLKRGATRKVKLTKGHFVVVS